MLVLGLKCLTKNHQKSGFSINQSCYRTHPLIYYNSHIKNYTSHYTAVSHHHLQYRSVRGLKTKSFELPFIARRCVRVELSSYHQYNSGCLTSIKIQRILKKIITHVLGRIRKRQLLTYYFLLVKQSLM